MQASLPPDDALEEETHVTSDVPCVGCGYNLRTLATEGDCPECGKPVATTLSLAGLRQWPLNAEFACDKLGFGAAVIIFFGIGAMVWLIGSLQLARRFGANDPYAAILRIATAITSIAFPVFIIPITMLGLHGFVGALFLMNFVIHYFAVHLIGVRLCRDLGMFKQRLMCWALIIFGAITLLLGLLLATSDTVVARLNHDAISPMIPALGFGWFIFLITTWACISSDIGKRRSIIEARHLRRLGKISRRQQKFVPKPEGSLEH